MLSATPERIREYNGSVKKDPEILRLTNQDKLINQEKYMSLQYTLLLVRAFGNAKMPGRPIGWII
jgi:hypothetical protein